MFHRRRLRLCALARRCLSAVLIVALLGGSLGYPLPVRRDKDRSSRYPCELHVCGCLSAEQCWQNCCCLSHAQKLAWAENNGVTPPAAWLATVTASAKPATVAATASGERDCCSHAQTLKTKPASKPLPESPPENSVRALLSFRGETCGAHGCSHASARMTCSQEQVSREHDTEDAQAASSDESSLVLSVALQKCRGLTPLWSLLATALPFPSVQEASEAAPLRGTICLHSERACALLFAPPVPPPRA